jgi:hypothetical protein
MNINVNHSRDLIRDDEVTIISLQFPILLLSTGANFENDKKLNKIIN